MKKSYSSTDQISHQCPECGGTMEQKNIAHEEHNAKGMFFIVESVPALVCRQCGAIYLDAHIDKLLDEIIDTTQPIKKIETPVYNFLKAKA